jgi:Flp pilus assembly protein TadG
VRRLPDIRREDGQGLVEFALVLPILLMVATGITSFGIVFYRYITLTDAVRTGARTLSLGRGLTDPCTPARDQTVNSAIDVGLKTNQVQVIVNGNSYPASCDGTDGTNWIQGNQVTVSASIPYSLDIFGVININTGHLTASATDAIE